MVPLEQRDQETRKFTKEAELTSTLHHLGLLMPFPLIPTVGRPIFVVVKATKGEELPHKEGKR